MTEGGAKMQIQAIKSLQISNKNSIKTKTEKIINNNADFSPIYNNPGLSLGFLGYVKLNKPDPFYTKQQLDASINILSKALQEQGIDEDKQFIIKEDVIKRLTKPSTQELGDLRHKLEVKANKNGEKVFNSRQIDRIVKAYSIETDEFLHGLLTNCGSKEDCEYHDDPHTTVVLFELAQRNLELAKKLSDRERYQEEDVLKKIILDDLGLIDEDGFEKTEFYAYIYLEEARQADGKRKYFDKQAVNIVKETLNDEQSQKIFNSIRGRIGYMNCGANVKYKLDPMQERKIWQVAVLDKNKLEAMSVLLAAGDDMDELQGDDIVDIAQGVLDDTVMYSAGDGKTPGIFESDNFSVQTINAWSAGKTFESIQKIDKIYDKKFMDRYEKYKDKIPGHHLFIEVSHMFEK